MYKNNDKSAFKLKVRRLAHSSCYVNHNVRIFYKNTIPYEGLYYRHSERPGHLL